MLPSVAMSMYCTLLASVPVIRAVPGFHASRLAFFSDRTLGPESQVPQTAGQDDSDDRARRRWLLPRILYLWLMVRIRSGLTIRDETITTRRTEGFSTPFSVTELVRK